MDEPASATIIPFPARRSDLAASAEHLADALTTLSLALIEQRDATQRWRDALLALSERLETLGPATG